MIRLPPGVTINYNIKIIVSDLTDDMIAWYREYGGTITNDTFYKGPKEVTRPHVKYRRGKASYYLQDGFGGVMLNFNSEDAGEALVFLIKFGDKITSHNMKDIEQYVY